MGNIRDVSDIVIALDKQQQREDARRCAADERHGRLTATPNGQLLACGICGYAAAATLMSTKDDDGVFSESKQKRKAAQQSR